MPSYNWIASDRRQLCWAHVKRNLQQMAEYSGGGHTAYIGWHLCLITNAIFRTRHRYEQNEVNDSIYLRRIRRLQQSLDSWLEKGTHVMVKRYRGRCQLLIKHKESRTQMFLVSEPGHLQPQTQIVVQRYKGRCEKLQSHRESLWLFLTDTSD